jgi:hypothetical protein
MSKAFELKLHSPAGSDPDVYEWPLTCGRGAVSNCCHYSYLGIAITCTCVLSNQCISI